MQGNRPGVERRVSNLSGIQLGLELFGVGPYVLHQVHARPDGIVRVFETVDMLAVGANVLGDKRHGQRARRSYHPFHASISFLFVLLGYQIERTNSVSR